MSKEKQIEEIRKDIFAAFGGYEKWEEDWQSLAKAVYNAGYRKQSEVVRCKDCEHFYQDGNVKVCRHWNCHSTEDDAYCSYAKMKGGAE